MLSKFCIAGLLLFCSVLNNCSTQGRDHRIMTYNIRHGVGMDRVLDLERTARVIQAAQADIVILNEVDDGTTRSWGVHQADTLGKLLKLNAVFAPSIDYDGGQYGNALLSKYPIIDFRIIDLSTDSLLEGRSVFISQLDIHGDTLTVMGTHLGLRQEERDTQVQRIIELLPRDDALILAGDFNFEPDTRTYSKIVSHLRDAIKLSQTEPASTFPADDPQRRIDYIFIGEAIQMISSKQFEHAEITSASDHQPQLIDFKLAP